jgi:hypothetical protein
MSSGHWPPLRQYASAKGQRSIISEAWWMQLCTATVGYVTRSNSESSRSVQSAHTWSGNIRYLESMYCRITERSNPEQSNYAIWSSQYIRGILRQELTSLENISDRCNLHTTCCLQLVTIMSYFNLYVRKTPMQITTRCTVLFMMTCTLQCNFLVMVAWLRARERTAR